MQQSFYNSYLLILILILPFTGFSQFTTASQTENAAGLSINPFNTNNDILDVGSTPDVYRVSVFTDANTPGPTPGLAWEVDYNSSHYSASLSLSLTGILGATNIYFTDVCLVEDPGDNSIHAITAWYVTTIYGNGWEIEDFEWNGSAFVSNGLTIIATGNAGSTVNIDGDDVGNFVVTYDDGNNLIWCVTGTLNSGLALNTSAFQIASNGIYPDVCIYNGTNHDVYFTYVDIGSYELHIDGASFSDLATANTFSYTQLIAPIAPPNSLYFSYPRIACPNSSGPVDWIVVVLESDHGNTFLIEGYNNNTGSTPIYYNDGVYTAPSCDLTSQFNFLPVVTYDVNQNIWVGWTLENSNGNIGCALDALFPVVVPCNGVGASIASTYWDVPNSLNSQDKIHSLSISSRNSASDIFLTYFNFYPAYDLITKWQSVAASSLKTVNHSNSMSGLEEIEKTLNNSADPNKLIMYVYDLQGRLIFESKGSLEKIRNKLKGGQGDLGASLYFFKIISDDGKINLISKFLTANK